MKKYTNSVIVLFVCMLILTPSTVYAEEMAYMPSFSIIQPITGAALPNENLTESLEARLNLYLVDSYANGSIDDQEFNDFVSSGMISENAFFANSVFVGDSLTVGFKDYCRTHRDSIASDTTHFLARVSCSAKAAISRNALTTHANIMPIYDGKVQYIEDSVSQMSDVSKMFICYGMNDLTGSTPKQFVADLQTLIDRIVAKSPDLQVYVISIPCVMADVDNGWLNNKNIQEANILLQDACAQNGWGFINITEHLMGSDNAIRPEYSADKYVHENSRAYKIWNSVLKDYAFMEITK
ncbi:MAG: SGNH/GDSL hydrolase family protein [Lachnospiraceae bacterium]|nr:SGNH/GDSL hydrolase family protein [Lachnospiraceae bacterium]